MPAIITGKKTQRYSTEFKVKAVEWSHHLGQPKAKQTNVRTGCAAVPDPQDLR